MGKIKLCTNAECVACEKKTVYKKDNDTFCTKCGKDLVPMCKMCKEVQLTDSDGAYCPECQVKQDEKMDKLFVNLRKVGGAVVAAGPVIVAVSKVIGTFKKSKKVADKAKKKLQKLKKK